MEEIFSLIKSDCETSINQILCNQIYGVQWESLDSFCEEIKTLWAISELGESALAKGRKVALG